MALSRFEELERERGKPLKEILIEEFTREGSTTAAARSLGVSQGTFSGWLLRCGLKIRSELVERETA